MRFEPGDIAIHEYLSIRQRGDLPDTLEIHCEWVADRVEIIKEATGENPHLSNYYRDGLYFVCNKDGKAYMVPVQELRLDVVNTMRRRKESREQ